MTDQFVQLNPDGAGKKIDTSELTVGTNTVERQRVVIGDPSSAAGLAVVANSQLVGTEAALATRTIVQDAPAVVSGGPIYAAGLLFGPIDTTGYLSVAVELSGIWGGSVLFQTSNSQSTWFPALGYDTTDGTGAAISQAFGATMLVFPVTGRYFQATVLPGLDAIVGQAITGVSYSVYLRATPVSLIQTVNVASDGLPVAGAGPGGGPRNIAVDTLGGVVLADADKPILGASSVNNGVLFVADTTGHNSIVVRVFGTFSAAISFQTSHDAANWDGVGGWPSGGASTLVSTASAAGTWVFPVLGKYFRAVITTYTSGMASCIAYLRSAQATVISGTPAMSLAQIAGNSVVSANVNGVLAVGGNTASGSSSSAYPVQAAGADSGGLTRRLLTDTAGALIFSGVDQQGTSRRLTTDPQGRTWVTDRTIDPDTGISLIELVRAMLTELRVVSFLLTSPRPDIEDPVSLRADPDFSNLN